MRILHARICAPQRSNPSFLGTFLATNQMFFLLTQYPNRYDWVRLEKGGFFWPAELSQHMCPSPSQGASMVSPAA
jgi:hypothetical protein